MKVELTVENADAVVANIYSYDKTLQREARLTVAAVAAFVGQRTAARCAKDSGFMRAHIRERISKGGLGFEVGWLAADFTGAGKEFYPPYPEFGTSQQEAQPALIPAYYEGSALLKARLSSSIRSAIARRR